MLVAFVPSTFVNTLAVLHGTLWWSVGHGEFLGNLEYSEIVFFFLG